MLTLSLIYEIYKIFELILEKNREKKKRLYLNDELPPVWKQSSTFKWNETGKLNQKIFGTFLK